MPIGGAKRNPRLYDAARFRGLKAKGFTIDCLTAAAKANSQDRFSHQIFLPRNL
jgi:hypothetical protein